MGNECVGLKIFSSSHKVYDESPTDQCLDKNELQTMAGEKQGVGVFLYSLTGSEGKKIDLQNRSAKEVANLFVSLDPKAKESFYFYSLPFQRESFLSLLRKYNPKEATQLIQKAKIRENSRSSSSLPSSRKSTSTQTVPTSYSTLREATNRISNENLQAKVFAFGEIHYTGIEVNPPFITFVKEAMPILIRDGVYDFVFECLPSSIPPAEYKSYFLTGDFSKSPKLSAYIHGMLNPSQRHLFDMMNLLRDLFRKGSVFNVYGSGIDLAEIGKGQFANLHPEAQSLKYSQEITIRTVTTAGKLLNQKRRVALLNGSLHNDIEYSDSIGIENFGLLPRFLKNQSIKSEDFVAVDLLMPETMSEQGRIAPSSGVYFLKEEGKKSYIVGFSEWYDPIKQYWQ